MAYKLSELKATNEATDTNVLVCVNDKGNVSSPSALLSSLTPRHLPQLTSPNSEGLQTNQRNEEEKMEKCKKQENILVKKQQQQRKFPFGGPTGSKGNPRVFPKLSMKPV